MYHPSMRCMTLPSHHFNPAMFPPPVQPPASIIYPDGSVGFPSSLRGSTSHKPRAKSLGRKDPKKRQRQRRQSDENLTFTYTGLDRTIADEFLGRQEQSHHGSEISGNGRKENRTDVALWKDLASQRKDNRNKFCYFVYTYFTLLYTFITLCNFLVCCFGQRDNISCRFDLWSEEVSVCCYKFQKHERLCLHFHVVSL